jgi:nitrate reductase gamma subunit
MDRALRLAILAGLLAVAAAAWGEQATGGTDARSAASPPATSGASQLSPAVTPETAEAGPVDLLSAATPSAGWAARPQWRPTGSGREGRLRALSRYKLYDVVRGPAFLAAWIVFALGVAWRVAQYVGLTARPGRLTAGLHGAAGSARARTALHPGYAGRGSRAADLPYLAGVRAAPARLWARMRQHALSTILGSNPVMATVSSLFHVLLFLAPLLLPAHAILFDLTFRISLPTLPEPLLDAFTVVVIAACLFFLVRRLAVSRVRALTTHRDWLVLGLVLVPFLSAFLAYHQLLPYRVILMIHMIAGELVIAAIPFTAIGHMPFILFARFFTAGEYSWRSGRRVWR